MYINIIKSFDGVIYRGVIQQITGHTYTFLDDVSKTNVEFTIQPDYAVRVITDEIYQLHKVYLDRTNKSSLLTEDDKRIIYSSDEPHITFKKLTAIRDINIDTYTDINDVPLDTLKESIQSIIHNQYDEQIKYISTDEDLTQTERDNLIAITDTALNKYKTFLDNSQSKVDVLNNWPSVFAENKKYNEFISNYIK